MKTKSKLIAIAAICCTLVLAFTACAGCTSYDGPTGTFTSSDNTGEFSFILYNTGIVKEVYEGADGVVKIYDPILLEKIDDNTYTDGIVSKFEVSQDKNTIKWYIGNTQTPVILTRDEAHIVPTAEATATPLPKITPSVPSNPILGVWAVESGGNFANEWLEFKDNGVVTYTWGYGTSFNNRDMTYEKIDEKHCKFADDYYDCILNDDMTRLTRTTVNYKGDTKKTVFYRAPADFVVPEKSM